MARKQQQGFVLALSLLVLLFAAVVVISSLQRTGVEDRVATSALHRSSLESAAEAGLFRLNSQVVEATCSGSLSGLTAHAKQQAECNCYAGRIADTGQLTILLDLSGSLGNGVQGNERRFSDEGMGIFWWIDHQQVDASACNVAEPVLPSLRVVSRASQGLGNDAVATAVVATRINFQIQSLLPENSDYYNNNGVLVSSDLVCGGSGGSSGYLGPKGSGQGIAQSNNECGSHQNGYDLQQSELEKIRDAFTEGSNYTFNINSTDQVRIYRSGGVDYFQAGSETLPLSMLIDGKVTVNITGDTAVLLDLDTSSVFFNIVVNGSASLTFGGTGNNDFKGFIYAPQSSVVLPSGSRVQASVIAASVAINNGGGLFYLDDADISDAMDDVRPRMETEFDYDFF